MFEHFVICGFVILRMNFAIRLQTVKQRRCLETVFWSLMHPLGCDKSERVSGCNIIQILLFSIFILQNMLQIQHQLEVLLLLRRLLPCHRRGRKFLRSVLRCLQNDVSVFHLRSLRNVLSVFRLH